MTNVIHLSSSSSESGFSQAHIDKFVEFMAECGCVPASGISIIPDDTPRYYTINGDKTTQKRGSYCLKTDGEFAFGWVHDHRCGETYDYVVKKKGGKKLSAEDKAIRDAKFAEAKIRRETEQIERNRAAAVVAKALWAGAEAVKHSTDHAYLVKKGIDGKYCRIKDGLLLIPGYADGVLWTVQTIDADGNKLFISGARKSGCYAPIADSGDDKSVIVITEGYATAESIRMATGYTCVAAFDCGNLEPVARAMREKYPEARIIIAADNDQWRFNRKKKPKDVSANDAPDGDSVAGDDPRWQEWSDAGVLENIGVIKAKAAAVAIGAHVLYPAIAQLTAGKPTDWNDYAAIKGLEAIKDRFEGLVSAATEYSGAVDGAEEDVPVPEVLADLGSDNSSAPIFYSDGDSGGGTSFNFNADKMPFIILGYDAGKYYFMPKSSGQVVELSPGSLAFMANLFQLAPLDYWLDTFGADGEDSHRKIAEYAANALMSLCHEKGVFRSDKVRGVGVWNDSGRGVFHCGDALYVDGKRTAVHDIETRYIYPKRDVTVPDLLEPLGSTDAAKLRDICRKISWEYELSGDLLAGWIVVAMVCSALKWRPHIWITGESESGKTTVMDEVILRILSYIVIRVDGGTSEAAIRQTLMCDGRPVIYDEAEGETVVDRSIMQGILQLVRRASSGSTVIKGSTSHKAIKFTVRSCFVFAAINTAEMQRADESRISKLVIKKARFDGADEFYKKLKTEIATTITPEYGHRLMARTIQNLPVLLKNCDTFVDAAAVVFGSRRAADQIAPMLAGAHLLTSLKEISLDDAIAWMNQRDFTPYTAVEEKTDPERIITYMSTRDIRYTTDAGGNQTRTISELLERFYNNDCAQDAERVLRVYGIWPLNDGVLIANASPRLKELMKDTPWTNWARPLGDIKGAEKMTPREFIKGMKSRAVKLPLSTFGFDGARQTNFGLPQNCSNEEISF